MSAHQRHRTVSLAGEVGIFSALAVREQLLCALSDADEVEVDLAQVTDLDSAGVQLMVAAKREAADHGKTLRFVSHSTAVIAILDLLGLTATLGDPVLLPGA